MLFKSHITKCDRLVRPGDEAGTTALREAFKRLGYGNRGTSHLSSQFDIWTCTIIATITIRRPKIIPYEFEKERYFTRIPTKENHEYILDNTR